jgi:signal transduction histidine kinase/CheY-like chemotaxis protein
VVALIAFIRQYIFKGAKKNAAAPYIFLVLCFYVVFSTVYTLFVLDISAMFVRILLGLIFLAAYTVIERSPIGIALTSFLSPTFMAAILIAEAVYFRLAYDSGDVLLFSYLTGIAMISLTYMKSKMLALHIAVVSAAITAILFGFQISLIGLQFTITQNAIFFVACIGINVLVCVFSVSYARTLNALVSAENEATLASQAKGNFLAKMSHEIRTPLNAIIGLTDAELRKAAAAHAEPLQKIRASGALLLSIINDILDMSKIESGKFDLNPAAYDFAEMLYDVVTLNTVRIGGKPVTFSIDADSNIPRVLLGDALRVKQLLSNLLSNAFKYTQKGTVGLRVTCRVEEGKARLAFEVSDTGMGIAREDVEKLFGEYTQFDRAKNRFIEGTGLGLSICKGLVDIMDGKITAQSELGKGSIFTAEIVQAVVDKTPVGEKTVRALGDFTYVPEYGEPDVGYIAMPYAKILVVDDVEINLEVVAACLEPYEMWVDCIDNGAEAVRRMNQGEPRYDLILMDHMMPDMDGIETARRIRELGTPYAKTVPIVALTANALVGNDKIFADNGFQDFLAKPIDLQKLDAVLRKWCLKK